jgi:hypothetical protein
MSRAQGLGEEKRLSPERLALGRIAQRSEIGKQERARKIFASLQEPQGAKEDERFFAARRKVGDAVNRAIDAAIAEASQALGEPVAIPYVEGLLERRMAEVEAAIAQLRAVAVGNAVAKPLKRKSPPSPSPGQHSKRPYGAQSELARLKRLWHSTLEPAERKLVTKKLRQLGYEPDSKARKKQALFIKPPSPRSSSPPPPPPPPPPSRKSPSPPRPPPKRKSPSPPRPPPKRKSPPRLLPPSPPASAALVAIEKPRSPSRSFSEQKGKGAAGQNASAKPVVLLFLAHAGVAQPTAWQKWKSGAPPGKILFVVHANAKTYEKDEFARKYGILEAKDRVAITKWCDKSLVFAQQAGIRYILKHWPDMAMIYLVSGDSVPIREAAELIALEEQSRLCGVRRPPSNAWKLTRTEWKCLGPTTSAKGVDVGRDMTDRDLYQHEQWLSLDKSDAQAIARFDFKRFDTLDEYFGSKQFHMRTPEREKFRGTHSEEGYEKHACPDEYYFGTALKASAWTGGKRAFDASFSSEPH